MKRGAVLPRLVEATLEFFGVLDVELGILQQELAHLRGKSARGEQQVGRSRRNPVAGSVEGMDERRERAASGMFQLLEVAPQTAWPPNMSSTAIFSLSSSSETSPKTAPSSFGELRMGRKPLERLLPVIGTRHHEILVIAGAHHVDKVNDLALPREDQPLRKAAKGFQRLESAGEHRQRQSARHLPPRF